MGRSAQGGLLLVALALLAVLLADWGPWRRSRAPPAPAPSVAAPAGALEPLREGGPILRGATRPGDATAGSETGHRFGVHGVVRRADGMPVAGAGLRVELRPIETPAEPVVRRATADAQGRYDVDLTPDFGLGRLIGSIAVQATHALYCSAEAFLAVTGADRAAAARAWTLDLVFAPCAMITGRLVDPEGNALQGSVGLFRTQGGGVSDDRMPPPRATAADGSFLVPARASGAYLLAGQAPDLAPVVVEVQAQVGASVDIGTLWTAPGVSVEGDIRINDEPAAHLRFQLACAAPLCRPLGMGPDGGALWRPDQARRWHAVGQTSASGHFVVQGLAEGRYRMSIGHGRTFVVARAVWKLRGIAVTAPDPLVTIDLRGTWAEVQVLGPDGEPLAHHAVEVARRRTRTDAAGCVRVLLSDDAAGVPVRDENGVDVGFVSQGKATVRLGARPRGQEGPDEEEAGGALRLELTGPGAGSIDVLGLRLERDADKVYRERRTWTLRRAGGVFRAPRAPAGVWNLEVRPGGSFEGGEGAWLPIIRAVTLSEGGETTLRLGVQPGARLRLRVMTPDGALVGATCTIRDSAGKSVDAWFACEASDSGGSLGPSEAGTTVVHPALRPGTYVLLFVFRNAVFPERVVRVLLAAGETKELDVQLEYGEASGGGVGGGVRGRCQTRVCR